MKKKENININERITNLMAEVVFENGKAFANIKFRNLSYGIITAIKFNCKGYNSLNELVEVNGKEYFSVVFQDLLVGLRETTIVSVELPSNDIRKLELREEKISYEDGKIEDVEIPVYVEYEYDVPVSAPEYKLISIIKETNNKAVCFPQELSNGYVCVCGRFNSLSDKQCCFCGLEKEQAFNRYNIDRLKYIEDSRRKQEEQEKIRRQEELEKKNEYEKIKAETEEKKRKKRKVTISIVVITAIIAFIVGAVLYDRNYKATYGLNTEEYAQWKEALEDYREWENTILGAYNDFCQYCNENEAQYYTYSEILSKQDLKVERNKVLSLYDSINEIDFPEKYEDIFEKIKKYQQLYYVMSIDLDQATSFSDDYPMGLWDKIKKIDAEITRLQNYLTNEYLVPEKVDLHSDVTQSYTPLTFSYSFSNGSFTSNTLSESEVSKAKSAANTYCVMLENKQSSISSITYTSTEYIGLMIIQFKYKVEYTNGLIRYGIVTVQNTSGTWSVNGMEMED